MQIRPADTGDHAGIDTLLRAVFPTDAEARLVQALRRDDADSLELIAEDSGAIVGMVMFSPVEAKSVDGRSVIGLGLAPLAVAEIHRQKGIGAALVETALDFLTALNPPFFVVLGEPDYYGRFGFEPASNHGWRWDADIENAVGDAFQIRIMDKNLMPTAGKISYARAFSEL